MRFEVLFGVGIACLLSGCPTTAPGPAADAVVADDAALKLDAALPEPDAAPPELDAAPPEPDAAPPERDAAPPELDAAPPERDAAPPELDAARPERDAAPPELDAARPERDAAPPAPDAAAELDAAPAPDAATGVCGDRIINGDEACDDGDAITNDCAIDTGPCTVCMADCIRGPGVEVPAPRIWDGEGGDGLWATALNWSPDGVPGADEWVVVGAGADVTAEAIRCRHLTVDAGAWVRQSARGLSCSVRVDGTFEASADGLIPNASTVTLAGTLAARTPWVDAAGTPFIFEDGARFENPNLALRVRLGVAMTFVLSQAGFQTLVAGALLEPAGWSDLALAVDVSRYVGDAAQITLMDFGRSDPAFAISADLAFERVAPDAGPDARLRWDAASARLELVFGPRAAPDDVRVALTPAAPTGAGAIRAQVETAHPTARLEFAWFIDDAPVVGQGPVLAGGFARGNTVRVEVSAITVDGRSGPFRAQTEIANAPPSIDALTIVPAQPTIADRLTLDAALWDADAADVPRLVDCRWQRWRDGWVDIPLANGAELAACDARAGCAAGVQVRALCAATDGAAQSAPVASNAVRLVDAVCAVDDPVCQPPAFGGVPTSDLLDYGYWYWPTNHRPVETWPVYQRVMHFLTGRYALAFNEETGAIAHFGLLTDQQDADAAAHRPVADIEALPGANIAFEAGPADAAIVATAFRAGEGPRDDRALLSEGGRVMNRVEFRNVDYAASPDLAGHVEIAAMPRHVVFHHRVTAPDAGVASSAARVRLSGEFLNDLGVVDWLSPDRAVRMTDADGVGWVFVVYDQAGSTTTLRLADDQQTLVAERTADAPSDSTSIALIAIPTTGLTAPLLGLYVHPEMGASIRYTLLDRDGAAARPTLDVPWDERLGAYRVDLGTLRRAGLNGSRNYDERPELHNWYGRHQLAIDTHGQGPMPVPLAFFGNGGASLSITGGVPMLRDGNGEPIGVAVQVSKNWHDASMGAWYHLYAQPIFDGIEAQTLELTMASSRWGADAYAASHAQLSLIGYSNAGGHWDESALGAFGESITYDPDLALGRAMVDDVRPFLVQSVDRWNWTGNVGGADFLRYRTAAEPQWIRRLARVRSRYFAPGPNLTDVGYSGVSSDGRIRGDIRVQMGRTDDLVRTYYHLEYTVLEDVRYDRLALFQMAADNYGDNGYTRLAYGNADAVIADRAIEDHGRTGYANDAERGIALAGAAPWVMLYDNRKIDERLPEHHADLMYVVRDFEANIGGVIVNTPHINLHRTRNGQSQMGLELGLPHVEGSPWCGAPCQGETRFIPAGSTIRATIEYLVVPADKARYYGASDYLAALPGESWRSTVMALTLAAGNLIEVAATIGQVRRSQPVEIDAAVGTIAADFTVDGGLGYVPIRVRGLPRHDGWQLERFEHDAWVPVDQAVHGNDFWQATVDPVAGTYTLTYTVANRGLMRYRLVWGR